MPCTVVCKCHGVVGRRAKGYATAKGYAMLMRKEIKESAIWPFNPPKIFWWARRARGLATLGGTKVYSFFSSFHCREFSGAHFGSTTALQKGICLGVKFGVCRLGLGFTVCDFAYRTVHTTDTHHAAPCRAARSSHADPTDRMPRPADRRGLTPTSASRARPAWLSWPPLPSSPSSHPSHPAAACRWAKP